MAVLYASISLRLTHEDKIQLRIPKNLSLKLHNTLGRLRAHQQVQELGKIPKNPSIVHEPSEFSKTLYLPFAHFKTPKSLSTNV